MPNSAAAPMAISSGACRIPLQVSVGVDHPGPSARTRCHDQSRQSCLGNLPPPRPIERKQQGGQARQADAGIHHSAEQQLHCQPTRRRSCIDGVGRRDRVCAAKFVVYKVEVDDPSLEAGPNTRPGSSARYDGAGASGLMPAGMAGRSSNTVPAKVCPGLRFLTRISGQRPRTVQPRRDLRRRLIPKRKHSPVDCVERSW